MPSLQERTIEVLRSRLDSGVRANANKVVPVRTGRLRRSLRYRVLRRGSDGVVLRATYLPYGDYVNAVGPKRGQRLRPVLYGQMANQLGRAVVDAARIAFLEGVKSWERDGDTFSVKVSTDAASSFKGES